MHSSIVFKQIVTGIVRLNWFVKWILGAWKSLERSNNVRLCQPILTKCHDCVLGINLILYMNLGQPSKGHENLNYNHMLTSMVGGGAVILGYTICGKGVYYLRLFK